MKERSIADIRNKLKDTPLEYLPQETRKYSKDQRIGIQKLIEQYNGYYNKYLDELKRLDEMLVYERKHADRDYICGIDEAGRGPLAGPVVSAAVILPKDLRILYVNDSKKVNENKREQLYDEIMEKAISVSVGIGCVEDIDTINILKATYQSMRKAVDGLSIQPDVLLVDAVTIPMIEIEQEPIIKGDAKSLSIAAASIIAKVTRDRMMRNYHDLYPEYGFDKNKGYGTKDHIDAIRSYGLCPIHRKTFTVQL